jgi:hypothetical protein
MAAMKAPAILLCLALCALASHASDKTWLTGKLLSYDDHTVQTYAANNGNGQTYNHEVSDLAIDTGDRILFVRGVANFRWSRVPNVTENAPISYRIDKDKVYILDDKGKEIKLSLVKTRLKDASPTP